MPGYLFHFCAEWQRARRAVQLEGESLAELKSSIIGEEGELNSESKLVQKLGLVNWRVDVEEQPGWVASKDLLESSEGRLNQTWSGPGLMRGITVGTLPSGPSTPRGPQPNLSLSRTLPSTLSGTSRSERWAPDTPRREVVLFTNPSSPLANMPPELCREEFVTEVRKRLHADKLFPNTVHVTDPSREVLLSVEDAEDLFEAMLVMQHPNGGALNLNMGRQLDVVVDRFFALSRLRVLMERGASSLATFFNTLDLDKSNFLESCEVRHFMKNSGAIPTLGEVKSHLASDGIDVDSLATTLYGALDFNKDAKVELWEMRRQMSLAAPPRMSLVEMVAHQEMKNGVGRCGFNNMMDRARFFDHLCRKESLDFSPEDAVRYFRHVAGGSGNRMLSQEDFSSFLKAIPQEVSWGVEPHAADRLFSAMGTRCLQQERWRQRDNPLPMEALCQAPDETQDEAEMRARFDRLWDRCVGTSGAGSGNAGRQLRDSCLRRYLEAAQTFWQAHQQQAQAPPASPKKGVGLMSPRQACRPVTLPRSLFPNISDVLATASVNLHVGQACVVRYRLTGASSFWGNAHNVLINDRESCPWPATRKVLGETPFVGLVPAGLTWFSGGGGGFYLRGQAFTRVDANLRADLPKDTSSGAPFLFGYVEITPPSLVRTTRTPKAGTGLAEEFELRLFCSTKHKIIGCIGEPLPVQVVHQVRPPPIATVQGRCEGRQCMLRWSTLDLGPQARETGVEAVRLYMRSLSGSAERTFSLDPETREWELQELSPDTEYEFRVRLENHAGPGREAVTTCRTNSLCAAPLVLTCAVSGTAAVELRWSAPKVLGNESTRDRFQQHKEAIECFEATLRVEDEEKVTGAEVEVDGMLDDLQRLAPSANAPLGRQCRWQAGSWKEDHKNGDIIASLGGLRPDTRYALEGLCAVNSMGKGGAAKNLIFWTVPQTPCIVNVRVKSGLVLVALSQTGGICVKEYTVSVALSTKPSEKTPFDLPQSNLRSNYDGHDAVPGLSTVPELSLPFEAMPTANSEETHVLHVRASNNGGWSEWSQVFQAVAIARQQGAEQAQAALVKAIEARRIDRLTHLLREVRDIEFSDGGSVVEEATELLAKLQDAKAKLMEAMQARDPEPLAKTLEVARQVQLPDLGKAEGLLRKLEGVVLKLETAKGIDALRLALKAAHEARLPPELLTEAVKRLGTREAAEQNLQEAMEAARVPCLVAALETATGMHLPSEADATTLLAALQQSESLLRYALEKGLICELEFALEDAAGSGLREEGLIGDCQALLQRLLEKQEAAKRRLESAMEARHPVQLQEALASGRANQVDSGSRKMDLGEAEELLRLLESLLEDNEAAEGIFQREAALVAAKDNLVPPPLLEIYELQLQRLKELHAALKRGDVERLRLALKAAQNCGVKIVETCEAAITYGEWADASREVEVAASLARTERLRKAVAAALEIGIAEDQMESANTTLNALQRRDLAAKRLHDAIEARKCESLLKNLKVACDADVQEPGLCEDALDLMEYLLVLRAEVNVVYERAELKTLYDTVAKASLMPSLPDREMEPARKLLNDLQKQEYEDIFIEMKQAKFAKNFRLLDYIAARAKRAAKCGVQVDGVENAEHLAVLAAEDGRASLETAVQDERIRRDYNRWYDSVPSCDENITLPAGMVTGSLHVGFTAGGSLTTILPREIVEGTIVVALEETKTANGSIVDFEATSRLIDKLLLAFKNLLDPDDDVKQLKESIFNDHGVPHERSSTYIEDGRLELQFAIYVRAPHSGLEIAEVVCEIGCVGVDILETGDRTQEAEVAIQEAFVQDGTDRPSLVSSLANSLSRHMTKSTTLGGPRLLSRNNNKGRLSDFVRHVRSRVLRRATVELSWRYPKGLMDNLDATCIVFEQEKLLEIIDHRGLHGARYGAGPNSGRGQNGPDATRGSVRYAGEEMDDQNRSGKQVMQVRLDLMPKQATDLVFVLSAYNSRNLAKFANLRAHVIDTDSLRELASVEVERAGSAEAVVMCSLYRLTDGLWRVNSFCVPSKGTARDYVPILGRLLELGYPRNVSMRNQVDPILMGMQTDLKLDRAVKTTTVSLDIDSTMSLSYAIELFKGGRGQSANDGEKHARRISTQTFKDRLVQALQNSGGDRFTANKVTIHPPSTKAFTNARMELEWGYPTSCGKRISSVTDRDTPEEENFLDGTCFLFEGQALREIVDYRGPHGVRIVHNGVLNYGGLWVGKVGIGDATGGSIRHMGEELNNAERIGKQIFQVRLDRLPSGATELFFALSAPTNGDVTKYNDVLLRMVDWDNPGHEIATVKWHKPTPDSDTESVVVCAMSVGHSATSGWTLDNFGCMSQGTCKDYRQILLCLRSIQEKRHALPPQWPFQVVLSMDTKEAREKTDKQALMLPRLPPAVLRKRRELDSPASSRSGTGELFSSSSPQGKSSPSIVDESEAWASRGSNVLENARRSVLQQQTRSVSLRSSRRYSK